MTFFNHLLPVGVSYMPVTVHNILADAVPFLFLLGRVSVKVFLRPFLSEVARSNFCWHQPRKRLLELLLILFYYLHPQVGTDGEFWQCSLGWKTPFWLRCPFFYMSRKIMCREQTVRGGKKKKSGSRAKLYFAMYAMPYRPSGWFICLLKSDCTSKNSLTVFLYNELCLSCCSNKQFSKNCVCCINCVGILVFRSASE